MKLNKKSQVQVNQKFQTETESKSSSPKCQICSRELKDVIQRCSRCKEGIYCGTVCQKKDWPAHKPNCIIKSVPKEKETAQKENVDLQDLLATANQGEEAADNLQKRMKDMGEAMDAFSKSPLYGTDEGIEVSMELMMNHLNGMENGGNEVMDLLGRTFSKAMNLSNNEKGQENN